MAELWNYNRRQRNRGSSLFKSTYGVWNDSRFNARTSIGHSMKLIRECSPNTPEEWDAYYRKSGETEQAALDAIPANLKGRRRDYAEARVHMDHGKTLEKLTEIAMNFKRDLEDAGIRVTEDEALNFTYIRAVDEAWIGYQRELAAETALDKYCQKNGLTWESTSTRVDLKRGVDYEIYNGDQRICGVQVKGSSYKRALRNSDDFSRIDQNLRGMNAQYQRENNVPVVYMFIARDLTVENYQEFDKLVKTELEKSDDKIEPRNNNNVGGSTIGESCGAALDELLRRLEQRSQTQQSPTSPHRSPTVRPCIR